MEINFKGDGKYFVTEIIEPYYPDGCFGRQPTEIIIKPTPLLLELLEYLELLEKSKKICKGMYEN